MKEEETGGRQGSVNSTSSEESIDEEEEKGKEKVKKKINPYVVRPTQENSGASFIALGPAQDMPQQLGIPVSQLIPQAPQQTQVAASPPPEANAHGVLECQATNYYVEEPSEVVSLTELAGTPKRRSAASGLSSQDENMMDTTTV